ncbi:MAG: hypothetical protein BYD32DRAFT_151644 [Podila humilis]|nr:MAG: hypothetical protein BYD32DRAFT_151644 [Podila humilis]
MLRNTMTGNLLSLFCLIDGEATPFSVEIDRTKTVDHLKDLIKAKKANTYSDVDADMLMLWRVSIPIDPPNKRKPIVLNEIHSATELDPTDDISDVFEDQPPKKTIHIIIQRPPQVHTPIPARASTPLPGYLSDNSRPGTPLSGDLRVDIKKITDKFFSPGTPTTDFLDAYVKGQRSLPVTTTGIKGLPKVLRRGVVETLDSGPSLLFLDLPSPPLKAGDPVPERFRSNVLLSVLEGLRENSLDDRDALFPVGILL